MSAPEAEHHNKSHSLALPDISGAVPTSAEARAKRWIAALEDELQYMKQERRGKQRFVILCSGLCPLLIDSHRKTTFYVSQGRAIRCMGILYTNLEDLVAENDCRYEEGSEDATPEYAATFFCFMPSLMVSIRQDRLQRGYIILVQVLPWLHERLMQLDVDDSQDMLKQVQVLNSNFFCSAY
jgi:hypothetical protein